MQPQNPQQPSTDGDQPQPMYWTRPYAPQAPELTAEIKQKSEDSRQRYPHLNLSAGEFVISDVHRHPIGLFQIWGGAALIIIAFLALLGLLVSNTANSAIGGMVPNSVLAVGIFLLSVLVMLGASVAAWVYKANRFYLTNESVIQNIQSSLFSNREQTVSLANIEDASYTKKGILQHMFNYGSIRLSTEGDETTYRFHFASDPRQQVAILNNAVEAFKSGRPTSHN